MSSFPPWGACLGFQADGVLRAYAFQVQVEISRSCHVCLEFRNVAFRVCSPRRPQMREYKSYKAFSLHMLFTSGCAKPKNLNLLGSGAAR